jgi:hypothetical protein
MDLTGKTIRHITTLTTFEVLARDDDGFVVRCLSEGNLPASIAWAFQAGGRYRLNLSLDVNERADQAAALFAEYEVV